LSIDNNRKTPPINRLVGFFSISLQQCHLLRDIGLRCHLLSLALRASLRWLLVILLF